MLVSGRLEEFHTNGSVDVVFRHDVQSGTDFTLMAHLAETSDTVRNCPLLPMA